jgi:hypothetical protein
MFYPPGKRTLEFEDPAKAEDYCQLATAEFVGFQWKMRWSFAAAGRSLEKGFGT